jgi:Kef-type K+ transport system membrane component KefB
MRAFGGIFLAVVLGLFAAYSVSKGSVYVSARRNVLTLILGAIFITTGIAMVLHISPLLSNMFFGAGLINIDKTAFRFFDSLQEVDWPLYIIFYVLAGANLEIGLLTSLGFIASLYIIFRCTGKIGGAYIGGLVVGAGKDLRRYMGLALIPQAGVALGLALLVKVSFPQIGDAIFATITATTVLYELFGPIATRYALLKAGDLNGAG